MEQHGADHQQAGRHCGGMPRRQYLRRIALALVMLALACSRSADPEPENQDSASDQTQSTPAPATGRLDILATVGDGGSVTITIANGTDQAIELRRALAVEQLQADEQWMALLAVGDLWIRQGCDADGDVLFPDGMAEDCIRIEPLTQIEVQPWLGTIGDAQCACERCTQVPAGRYRIAAQGCDGQAHHSAIIPIRIREE